MGSSVLFIYREVDCLSTNSVCPWQTSCSDVMWLPPTGGKTSPRCHCAHFLMPPWTMALIVWDTIVTAGSWSDQLCLFVCLFSLNYPKQSWKQLAWTLIIPPCYDIKRQHAVPFLLITKANQAHLSGPTLTRVFRLKDFICKKVIIKSKSFLICVTVLLV